LLPLLIARISKVVRTCFGILRQLRSVGRSIPRDAKRQLIDIQTFVLSRVDYCNAAVTGIPKQQTDRLQAVINASVRLDSDNRKFDHITLVLRHDLKVPEQHGTKLLAKPHQAVVI
jgi:hypothetical protein